MNTLFNFSLSNTSSTPSLTSYMHAFKFVYIENVIYPSIFRFFFKISQILQKIKRFLKAFSNSNLISECLNSTCLLSQFEFVAGHSVVSQFFEEYFSTSAFSTPY
jgi:hypothetical protein